MRVRTQRLVASFLMLTCALSPAVGAESKPYYTYSLAMDEAGKAQAQESVHYIGGKSSEGAQLGAVVAKGDFNSDGIDDLVATAPYYSTYDRRSRGKVEVFFGRKDFATHLASTDTVPDIAFLGAANDGGLGTSFVAGDVNDDGIDDMLMGAPGENSVYIMYGSKIRYSQPSTINLSNIPTDWLIRGRSEDGQFGFSVDSGDMNGDRVDDIIIGAPFSSNGSMQHNGKVYAIYGHKGVSRGILMYMNYSAPDLSFAGQKADDRFGITLTHGDLDRDRKTDLIVGSYMATSGPSKQTGTVTIFPGAELGHSAGVSVGSISAASGATSTNTLLTADRSFDWFGYSLSVGDLNNDDVDDLAISSFPYLKNSYQGEVDVLWGKKGGEKGGDFEHATLSRVYAPDEHSLLGGAVVIADLNQDGASDLLIGAPTNAPGDDTKMGRVYALTMFPRNNDAWNFSKNPADMTIVGRDSSDWFGSAMVAGDFDNDSQRDLAIGAPGEGSGAIEYLSGPLFPRGGVSYTLPEASDYVNRGSFMIQAMNGLKYHEKNKDFIASCLAQPEFCFYQFSSQTKFAGLSMAPQVQLYPDVKPDDSYYEAVNDATIMGYVRGFPDEQNSPFYPEKSITRIHALKILMAASGILPWKELYEMKAELAGVKDGTRDRNQDPITSQKTPYKDVSAHIAHMWWYPRYLNFAYLTGIIDDTVFFQPDSPLTQKDLDLWISRIQEYVARRS